MMSEVNRIIITDIKNNVENIIEKTFENMNFSEGSGEQDANIDLTGLYCDGGEINIDQRQVLKVVAGEFRRNCSRYSSS